MELEPEEEEFLNWLETIADYSVAWSTITQKMKEIEDIPQEENLKDHNPTIQLNFKGGITVSLNDDGESMYPIKDIRQALLGQPLD